MGTSEQQEIGEAVARIGQLREELAKFSKHHLPTAPNPPAAEAVIRRIEAKLGRVLPADYRAFLAQHDGWPGFVGDNDILSTSQMLGGKMAERLSTIKAQMRSEGEDRAARGFIIGASLFNWRVLYFDLDKRRKDDGIDVVLWDHGDDERYRSFLAYLKNVAQIFERRVASEKSKKRTRKTGH